MLEVLVGVEGILGASHASCVEIESARKLSGAWDIHVDKTIGGIIRLGRTFAEAAEWME